MAIAPRVKGVRVSLRPVTPDDYPMIYAMESDPSVAFRWRTQGLSTSPENTIQTLWNSILLQYIVVDSATLQPLGLVNCHNPDLINGNADLAAIAVPDSRGDGFVLHGVALLIDVAFQGFPLEKLYIQCPDYNLAQFESATDRGYIAVEARLRDHYLYDGQRYDKIIASISRTRWDQIRPQLEGSVLFGHG